MLKKKLFHFIVPVFTLMVFLCNCFVVSAEELDQFETTILDIMNEKRTIFVMDPEFYREAEDKGLSFDELLREKAISTYLTRKRLGIPAIVPFGVGNNGQCLYTNVPLIQQTESYNCGPTAALQVLYGMGCQNQVYGQTDADKISSLEEDSGTDSSGTMVYRLTNTLNKYTTRVNYEYVLGSGMTMDEFQKKVETSLFYDTAPILHARTEYLEYYSGHRSGHYIAVREIDKTTGKIRLQDCNKNNKFFGQHVVSIEEAFKTINEENSRYLICLEY
ncbi:MAG: hypothetical protein HFH83_02620 [Lachnospiraceae bacterium]|nr:hypothetical protein [Lachnospiraceae bacterium]